MTNAVLSIVRGMGWETAQPSDSIGILGLDSLDVLELFVKIQDAMGVDIDARDIDNGTTIDDIQRKVEHAGVQN